MRIVLFTVENREFIPSVLDSVIDAYGRNVVKAYVSRTIYGYRFIRRRLVFLLKNGYPFCIRSGDWVRLARARLGTYLDGERRGGSVCEILRDRGIDAEYISEIRTEQTRERLRALNADVFLFCPFDKIAGPKFLAIPRLGTFNLHLGKLPEYRGGLHAFWVLRFGDSEAGTTVHRVTTELDAGEIVAEHRFAVRTKCMRDLMHETLGAAGELTVSALRRIEAGSWTPPDISERRPAYHMLPSRHDFRAFYERGCVLV